MTTRHRHLPNCVTRFRLETMITTMTTTTTTTTTTAAARRIQTPTKLILTNILDRTAFITAAALGTVQDIHTMIPPSTQSSSVFSA